MSESVAAHAAVDWPPDAQFGSATPGKIGMWIFLISDAFSFAGLLLAYGMLRSGAPAWRAPGEPPLGVAFTAGLTMLLVCSSLTNVLGYLAAVEGRRRQAALFLALTALGGALFLVGQFQEWFGIWAPGLVHEGLVLGRSARASTFFVTTGYHGLHVLVGVLYILAVLAQYLRGRAGPRQIELLGLYWCFVDFVWVFVFSFLYLMP
jgi:heme/copper-type cytochrome/quinol oxidase subunit 3